MTETVNVERDIAIAQALDEIGVLGSSDQTDVDEFIAELEQRGYRIEATRQAEADKAELVSWLIDYRDELVWQGMEDRATKLEALLAKHGGRDE